MFQVEKMKELRNVHIENNMEAEKYQQQEV